MYVGPTLDCPGGKRAESVMIDPFAYAPEPLLTLGLVYSQVSAKVQAESETGCSEVW